MPRDDRPLLSSQDISGGRAPVAAAGANSYPEHFTSQLKDAFQRCKNEHGSGALLLISLDNLSMILSGYGHDVSETVVYALMSQIRAMLGNAEAIERLQRDQLGVILRGSYPEDTSRAAQRIITLIQNYGRDNFATAALHVMGTVGAVHFPQDAGDPEDALDKAYVALRSQRDSFYRPYTDTQKEADLSRQQMGLASYLYSAYRENRMRLAWQPVIESDTGNIAHYEALLRMVNLGGKVTSAGPLIPVAEKMGLIEDIDTMVLEWVAEELRKAPQVAIAFNVSNHTTVNPLWLARAQALVEAAPEIAPRMTVEITETAAHRDLRRVAFFVASMQSMGCQVALDDFGSGYTSFRQLKALSVDFVKIDGVFIKDLAVSADSRFFVRTLLDFARGFGLKTVAEFVETGEVAKILMEMGVDYMQGFYFGKPETNRRWLAEGEYKAD